MRCPDPLTQAASYYPCGLLMPGRVYVQGTPTREDFTGHERDDETGLHYMGARYYSAALGRFTSTDPMNEYPSPYVYVGNNPISLIDPTGMFSTEVTENEDGTYTVVSSDPSDGDKGIYVDEAGGTRGGKIGESVSLYSFINKGEAVTGAVIDLGDRSGMSFLDGMYGMPVAQYMPLAVGGMPYDFKRRDMKDGATGDAAIKHMYRGMVVAQGDDMPMIASARDVGNIAAGIVAGQTGQPWEYALIGFESLEAVQKLKLSYTIGSRVTEAPGTVRTQKVGFSLGSEIFRDRQRAIYNSRPNPMTGF